MPDPYAQRSQMIKLITEKARAFAVANGADPNMAQSFVTTALGIANAESGFTPDIVGDGGSSFGLFQNHIQGRGAGSTPQQLKDPNYNIDLSLPELYQHFSRYYGRIQDPVQLAVETARTAQRPDFTKPANISHYADAVSQVVSGGAIPGPGQIVSTYPSTVDVGITHQPGARATIPGIEPPTFKGATAAEINARINQFITQAAGTDDIYDSKTLIQNAIGLAEIGKYLQSIQTVPHTGPNGQTYDLPPEIAARLEQEFGISQASINARYAEMQTSAATQLAVASMNNATTRDVAGARLGFDYYTAEKDYNLKAAALGLDTQKFNFQSALSLAQFTEGQRQFDITAQGTPFQQRQFAWTQEQGKEANAIDRERLAMQRDLGYGGLNIDQQRLGIEQQAGLRAERTSIMSAYSDLLQQQIAAGQITQRGAEKALDSLIDLYKLSPTTSGYRAGYEPGGAYATFLGQVGGNYDPGMYRMRQFPIDLETMAKLNGQFDMSKAWQSAQDMVDQTMPKVNAQVNQMVPAAGVGTLPGGSPTTLPQQSPGTTPMQGIPQSGSQSTSPMPGSSHPQTSLPAPSPPQSHALPAAPTQAPSLTPPQPTVSQQQPPTPPSTPPTCGPGYKRAWDGTTWTCIAG